METFKDLALDSAMVMAEDNDIAVGDIACEPSGVRVREQGTNVENKIGGLHSFLDTWEGNCTIE